MFQRFAKMGPGRSLALLHEELEKDPATTVAYSTLRRYADRWRWVERAASIDDHRTLLAIGQDEVQLAKFHLGKLGEALRSKAMRAVEQLNVGAIKPSTIPALVKAAQELVLVSKGEPSEIVEERVPHEVRGVLNRLKELSDDEIERILSQLKADGDRPARGRADEPAAERPH